ncbi:fat-like cadherin-related tumor suppressor homolog isoform X2 [Episyrphus balteatus]|uniref:fat-like cadherin-related tumor suppressor homolog isoform X2 n=1 Tax=Episyrphus balteatus TaxID=286459 RepID=UPI002485091C|nr:fat-like cadherin-related tumor suppressor homolog isoform X2 [Episyrphus balteatus]
MRYKKCVNKGQIRYVFFWAIFVGSFNCSAYSSYHPENYSISSISAVSSSIISSSSSSNSITSSSNNIDDYVNDDIRLDHDASYVFRFKHSIYNVTIPENSVGKTYALQLPDEDKVGIQVIPNLDVKYRIISGDRDKLFKAEERLVGGFAFLAIKTRTSNVILNREKTDEYRLGVKAFGTQLEPNGKHLYESETVVLLRVLDRNDLSPLFYPTEYSKTVPEDTPLHKSILQVNAEDADLGINGEIYYSFLQENDNFAVHPTSGVITLTRSLHYLEKNIHELIVLANDRVSAASHRLNQASKAKVIIKVEPVNLYPPDIYVRTLPYVEEGANANVYGIIRVTDKDQGIHGRIKGVELVSGDPDGHFRIRPSPKPGEYFIEIHSLLDREKTPQGYNLTFRAEDRGIPPQSSYKTIPVHISDANDNSPVFNRQIYEVTVPETSPPNTPVIRLKVTDQDVGKNSQVFLEIVGGNEGGEFRINPDTGMLYTQKKLDAETKAFYTLTVSAIDQGNVGTRKQSSAKVKINVQDTNDNDPIFDFINNTVWIDENEPAGTTVIKISARDKDSGENAYISYSIANLNEVPFDVDHFSGVLRTSKLIDYETMRREYVLSVRASDWGLPFRRQTEIELIVKIKDVNDNRPQFERTDCSGYVSRQTAVGMDILTLSAIDFDSGNFITYRLVSGNEDGCFNLDQTSGVLSVGCDLSDVGVPEREVNVTATDGTHFADIMTIKINLIDEKQSYFLNRGTGDVLGHSISMLDGGSFECRDTGIARRQAEILAAAEKNNMPGRDYNPQADFVMMPIRYGENVHAPEFVDVPLELKINETVQLGETVAWIKARDRDLGYNGKLVYGISDGDHDSVFRIDPDTGELQIIGYLDRERQEEYVLNVTVYDLGKPQKSSSKMFPITVLDQNDNPPKFEKSLASFRVTEHAKNGTVIFHLKATDADIGENAKITYSMVTETSSFQIEPETGILYVSQPLDREEKEVYELLIRATDNGSPTTLSADAVVLVIVDDVNDNVPTFKLPEYTFRVREDIPKGTVIAVVQATDADIGPAGEVLYSFDDENDSDDKLFKIDKHTGTIRTIGYLDFEERQLHSLCVRAIDRGTPALSSEATVIIEIIDVNENRYAPEFEDFVLMGNVTENQPPDTHVMNIIATDADPPGPDSRVVYSIRGGDGLGIFSIDSEGSLRTMALLDIESKPSYWLTVCAQDQAIVPLHSCIEVFIKVLNENDNVPLTESPVYYPTVPEGSPPGVEVLQLKAEDRDVDPDEHITYRIISGNPEGFFAINGTTGVITTTARKLDRENQPEHIMEILISDGGIPPLSSTTRVIVSVDDINDQSPEFDQRFYKVQIPATVEIDKPLFQVLAIDNDYGENGRVTYAIKSGKGKAKFRIDPATGVIYAAKPFEPETEYDLAIRAEDNGDPKRMHTTRVNVIVVPVSGPSLHPPVIKSLDQEVDVTETDRPGFLVALVQAVDEDNDQLWYDITDGDPRNEFYIARDNGNILLTKSLDWEIQKEYNLTISVTDGSHEVSTQLYVHVIDVNDHRPEFTDSVYRIDISENIDEETEILQLHATDMDEDKKIFYTLHAAQNPISLTLFRIDSITGNVIVTQRLDRERIAEHVLVAIAKDQGTPAKRNYAKIIITVHDHNDHHPEFTTKIVQGKVFESAALGTKVAQLFAIDRDLGLNAKITYSIASGNIGNVFDIDPIMGIISVNKELDINSMPEYMLQVKASDHGKPPLSSQVPVHIIITMGENDPPRFIKEQTSVEIYENRPIGTYVTQIEARSTSSVNYEIINGNYGDLFQINPSTGVITTKDIVDYEKVKLINLTVIATNLASISSQSSTIIHILDQNDNTPHFLQNIYWGEISESAPISSLILSKDRPSDANTTSEQISFSKNQNKGPFQSSLVVNQNPLVIRAVDLDSGLNALLRYDIVENLAKRYFDIDSTTGAIKTVMLLDYEEIPFFDFHVQVTDLGTPRLSSDTTTRVQITVTNVNDCAPVFEKNEYNVTLLLPTYENVIVVTVNATDPDGSEISTIRYDIIEGNEGNAFAMDPETGVITTRDVERLNSLYKLHVRASDGKYSNVTNVVIIVETSENYGLYFKKSTVEGVISENSTKITTIATVNVLGSKLNEHVEYKILNPTKLFRIGLTSGAIESTGQIFDREVCDNYELIVEARSQVHMDGKPRVAHVVVNITVLDINDNCPMFVNLPYYAVVSVDDPKGSFVTKVHAVDLDSYENGEVRYEMKRGHGELFKVDRKTGDVTLKQSLEGHNRDYELLIAAYDGASTPCSTEVGVHVKVIDKSMPVFNKQFYSVSVSENIEIYTPLAVTIQADSPLGRKLIYTIAKGNEMEEFALDFNTGTITVADELDYERVQNYDLIVRATDSVSGVSAEVPVSIMVLDVNDSPPEIEHDTYNISVSEGSPFGTSLLKINARDNDTGANGQITFAIDSSHQNNSSENFHLDPLEGILYLKKSLDHEMQSVHHFTVIATDGGSPSLTSTAHVWVSVIDINDNAPKFEEPSYTCVLSVHAKRGQFVISVKASDPDYVDHANLVYKIAQGNEMQTFDIDSSTGTITLLNMNNFAEQQTTTLNVSVTDGIYTSFTRVKINILPGNLNSPVFTQPSYEANIKENLLPGHLVTTVTALDKDLGEFGTFTYDIFSDTLKELFSIDKIKGIIESKVSFDRELCSHYEIPIIASDIGGRSGFTIVKVKITDENDNPPVFVLNEYHAVINANYQLNIPFVKVKALDKDEHQNSVLVYSMYEPENQKIKNLFQVDENNGSISLQASVANYANEIFEFFIRANDGGSPSLHTDVPVSVLIVKDDIDIPTFEHKERNQFISEVSTPGTLISRVRLLGNLTGSYKIISGFDEDKQFAINQEGEITLTKTLDREQKEIHTIGVLAEIGSSPAYSAVSEIILHVQDENDNAPIFESNPYSILLAENAEKGTSIVKVTAHDSDAGSNGEIRYFLPDDIGDIANVFDIDVYSGWITTLIPVDREKRSEYRFQVVATDHGQSKHIGKTTVMIKLKDYNDNCLLFKSPNYTTSVSEDALPGTVLVQLSVTDKDADANTAVEYYITSGDPLSQFHIRQTGELFTAKPLDREQTSSYFLNIIATDGKYSASTNVTIVVKDVNDNPPYCLKYRYKETINELIMPGTVVTQIIATDADEEANSKLRFYLTGNKSDDFVLDKISGVLKTSRKIDRETVSKYYLTAHVQDRDQLSWECISKIEISVADTNDNHPLFSMTEYSLILPEDAEIGTLATKVHATDRDVGVNRKIRYSFLDSGNDTFGISEDSGIITLKKSLDRESIAWYNLSVIATDQGLPQLSSIATLIVNVQDINDNPPEFTQQHYFANIPENCIIGSEVAQVLATSRDTGVNADIYYSIIGGNEQKKFAINRNTGSVYCNGELDFEKIRHFLITIQAVDGGTPPLSNLASLNVSVTDVNDNNPQFAQNSYNARIREDALIGDKILQLKAFDADSDENGRIFYNIERGDRLNQFQIDNNTGYLSVKGPLDRESISSYVLEIRARDNGTPELSSYVHVNIDISDANDNPPLFNKSNYTIIVQEDKQLGHVLIKFEIIDADTAPNSAPYTFDFRSGNDGGAFRLEQDGTLRTATRFNHKVRSVYNMLIRVFDNGTPPLYSDAWVTVKVIEESQYPPVITPVEILINSYQDEFPGGAIGRIYATDQDKYDNLIYQLAPTAGVLYSPHTLFNISKDDGSLYALPNLDVGDYRLNVTASDGKFTAHVVIKITVDLISKEMLENAIILRFSNVTPEDFILSHRKGFIRSIRTAMRTRQKDIVIISVQPYNESASNELDSHRRYARHSILADVVKNQLDVVFTVRKQQVNPNDDGYFSAKEIQATVADNMEEIEEATNLIIEQIVKTKCIQSQCVHGVCKDKIVLDRKNINTIATDVTSFISAVYQHLNECKCQQGYGGEKCNEAVNSCAAKPCPMYKICLPEGSDLEEGHRCVCPHGYTGPTCDHDVKKCIGYSCYKPLNPVSLSGKSYAHYKIDKVVGKKIFEDQLIFTLRVRTLQQTGNLMYASGKVDYNILEISNGVVQYRFDLGSGEGLISVSSIYVSDGEWHEIKLERERNSAKLVVDGKHTAQGSAPGVNGILNLQSNDIFLGAEVRPHPSVLGFEDIQRGFVGCMDDIRLARESVPLHMTGSSTIAVLKRFANVEFTCDSSTILVPLGICGTQPCFNGGICKNIGINNFECQCHPRFTGPFCKDDLDPCSSSPCLFGGKCHAEVSGNYSCSCPAGMSGKRCEFGRFCSPNPCKNGGVCEEGDYMAHCMCRGYTGATCEIDLDECENQPCGNGATCVNEAGSFRCICPPDLTGASCGDPLYSNSITSQLRNLPLIDMIGIACAIIGVVLLLGCLCYYICSRKTMNQAGGSVNNDPRKDITLNAVMPKEDYKRSSKLSNLEVQQRPQSYTTSSNDIPYPVSTVFVNNLDILRSYGSAGDELENVPPEYQKLNCTNQHININGTTSSDAESLHKQTWSDQMQLKTFSDNKLNNGRKIEQQHHSNQHTMRLGSLKPTSTLNSKLLHVNLPNINNSQSAFEDSPNNHGQYHWDCSDWARRSQNPLPDITEVPGIEVPDSSSFHSNESNESHPKSVHIPLNLGPVDPVRDIETLNEDIESEYVEESESECSEKPLSMSFETHTPISGLNLLDSGSEEYRFNTVPLVVNNSNKCDIYHRHPNSYLPRYNIQSETDGETSMCSTKLLNSQIRRTIPGSNNDSDDEEVSGYGFPNRRCKRQISDIDNIVSKCGPGENMSLLGSYHLGDCESNSDISTQICEIEDSEFEDTRPSTRSKSATLTNNASSLASVGSSSKGSSSGKKAVNWSSSVHQTDV